MAHGPEAGTEWPQREERRMQTDRVRRTDGRMGGCMLHGAGSENESERDSDVPRPAPKKSSSPPSEELLTPYLMSAAASLEQFFIFSPDLLLSLAEGWGVADWMLKCNLKERGNPSLVAKGFTQKSSHPKLPT